MHTFGKLIWVDTKLFLRNFMALFFLLAFPVLMLLINGVIYGNQPVPQLGGLGGVDVTVPGYIVAMVIGTAGFLNLPIELADYRSKGILRRFRATPLRPGWVLGSQAVVALGASLVGMLIQITLGWTIYRMHLPESPLAVLLGFFFICLCLFTTGFLIASLVKNPGAARAVGMALYFPMMFLSGGTMPGEFMPESLHRIAQWLPLTHAVSLFKDLWFGRAFDPINAAVLLGLAVVSGLIAVRFFRWE